MPETKFAHPESGQESLDSSTLSKETTNKLLRDVKDAISSRDEWEQKKIKDYKRRFGIRKAKDFPWVGCSNLNIPLTDAKIREAKPNFVNAVFGVTPMLTLEPVSKSDPERARRAELFYDWLVRYRMKNSWLETLHLIDLVLMYGVGYMKVVWNYKTQRSTMTYDLSDLPQPFERTQSDQELRNVAFLEFGLMGGDPEDEQAIASFIRQYRAGKSMLHITKRVVECNYPGWHAIDARDIVVPWDSNDDVDSLPFCSQRLYLTPEEIEDKVATGYFKQEAAKKVLDKFAQRGKTGSIVTDSQRNIREEIERAREGINNSEVDRSYVDAHEIYFWHDVNDWMGGYPYESITPAEAGVAEDPFAQMIGGARRAPPCARFTNSCCTAALTSAP